MPYIINNTDSSLTVTVPDGVVDTTNYSLALVGRNVSNYGQYFAQNTIRQMENFASSTPPSINNPLIGQLWYDKNESLLRVYDGAIWKRATNITVGNDSEKPTASFGSGGAGFYNTTIDKLQIHDGSSWKDASYAGRVTSEYIADTTNGSPSAFGSRIRNIFLTDTTGRKHPVLAISYVKTTTAGGQNSGSTSIDGQSETIMALHSDSEFTVSSSVAPIVDGITVAALTTELTSAGGIAASRPGRASGVIKAGMNVRYEYEQQAVINANEIYAASSIGTASNRIPDIYAGDIDSLGTITSDQSETDVLNANIINVVDTITVGGNISVDGSGTFDSIIVESDTVLNGQTTINGVLTVNGVSTQTIGTASEVIEDFYGANIMTTALTVAGNADIAGADIAHLEVTGTTTLAKANVNGTLAAVTLTDGTASLSSGSLTGGVNGSFSGTVTADTITDGTASLSSGSLTGGVNGSFSGTVTGSSLTDGTASLSSGSLTGGVNGSFSGTVTGSELTDGTMSVTSGSLTGGVNGSFSGTVTADTITDGTMSISSGSLTGGSSATFSATVTADTFDGTATSAQYADLAEKYEADENYEPGTVVKLGGVNEITQTTEEGDTEVFGVISTDPAYLMNSKAPGLAVAMTGRVPVKVIGKVKKGERLISSNVHGVAIGLGDTAYDPRKVIGRALQDKTSDSVDLIETVVGVK